MTAYNTFKTYLMHKAGESNTWTKLIDIKDYPDMGSAPPTLDATTLSDPGHVYINDIEDTGGAFEFTCNYTKEGYIAVKAVQGVKDHDFALWLGATESGGVYTPDGSLGKFPFKGELAVWKLGGSVSAVQEMRISIAPSTLPDLDTSV